MFFGHFKFRLEKDCIPKEKVLGHQVIWFFGHFKFKLEKDCFPKEKGLGHQVIWSFDHFNLKRENNPKAFKEQQNKKSSGFLVTLNAY